MRLEEYVEIDYLRDCILPDVRGWCDWREEGDITYYPHTIQALMYLADSCLEEYLEYAENDAAYEFVQKYAKVIGVENISFKQLERLCSQKPAPLCYLPATLRHAYGASDNIFLDCWNAYHIVSDELEWTIANIKIWTEEWQAAKPIYDGIDTLVNYLKEDNERFHEIFKLWNQCRKR